MVIIYKCVKAQEIRVVKFLLIYKMLLKINIIKLLNILQ